jgi:hypothetical protein
LRKQDENPFSRTVSRMDAAVERTGMYLPRVLEKGFASCVNALPGKK